MVTAAVFTCTQIILTQVYLHADIIIIYVAMHICIN